MTILLKEYSTKEEFERDSKIQNRNGLRALIHNAPYKITWVSGIDDPANAPTPKRQLTDDQLLDEIATDKNVERV